MPSAPRLDTQPRPNHDQLVCNTAFVQLFNRVSSEQPIRPFSQFSSINRHLSPISVDGPIWPLLLTLVVIEACSSCGDDSGNGRECRGGNRKVVEWLPVVAWILVEWLPVVVWLGGCWWLPGQVVALNELCKSTEKAPSNTVDVAISS